MTGSEDCLYLNVYRPIVRRIYSSECLRLISFPKVPKNVPQNKLLPVMVFIHGGGYFAGSPSPSMVGPQYFMENGEVILVSMAYRLGVFGMLVYSNRNANNKNIKIITGFLSTGDEHSPGNFGLKDQTLALKWVK